MSHRIARAGDLGGEIVERGVRVDSLDDVLGQRAKIEDVGDCVQVRVDTEVACGPRPIRPRGGR